MNNLFKNKAVIAVLLILEAALLIFGTVLVCDSITNKRELGDARADYYLYTAVGDYENLVENMGDVISEEDFNYVVQKKNSGGNVIEVSITKNPDGSLEVIEYIPTNELLGGYKVYSVRVFQPDEADEFAAYIYGTE